MDNIAIKTVDLTRYYGKTRAVDGLNLQVERGELFGFLGPNGAGKTTTIKMLTCILKPTRGTALIEGYDIVRNRMAVKKIIGYSPEYPILYEALTGKEFLDFIAAVHGMSEYERRRRIREMLELFDLIEVADKQLKGYSKGMKRKVSLAAALIHRPRVLFLDEPLMGLDAKTARLVKDMLNELCETGHTVFMSTHIMEIAERVCKRVAIINKGRVVAIGTLEELKKEAHAPTLEDIFLKITGGLEEKDLLKYL